MEANYLVLMYKDISKQQICIISGWTKRETGNPIVLFITIDTYLTIGKYVYDISCILQIIKSSENEDDMSFLSFVCLT